MIEPIKVKDVMEAFLPYAGSQEKFAKALNDKLVNTDVSRVAVTNWCNAKSTPSTDFLLVCAAVYQDWRRSWAMACLKVKLPEVFDSGIMEFKLPIAG